MANYGELSLLERNRYGGANPRALGSIGTLLAGGNTQAAFNKGALQGGQLQNVLAQARMRQQRQVALENLASEADSAGNHKLANMLRLSNSAEDAAKAQNTDMDTSHRSVLWDQSQQPTPDLNQINAGLLAMAKDPQQLSRVEGNTIVSALQTPDRQSFQPTAVGQADISEKGAQAKAAVATAAERYAQADRARAGIGVDKAGNYDIREGANGTVRVNKLTGEVTPLTIGDALLRAPIKPSEEKAQPSIIGSILGKGMDANNNPIIDPQQAAEFASRKAANPNASDYQILSGIQQSRQDAATDPGPPSGFAGDVPSKLSQMFGTPAYPPQTTSPTQGAETPTSTASPGYTNSTVGGSPHPEGTKLVGPDGKLYVVQNGLPVLAQ